MANKRVLMETTRGNITIELFEKEAPVTVANFLNYVANKYYEGTIFHRVIRGFMIQGGGLTPNMGTKPGVGPKIINEAGNGLGNEIGTIAMARTSEIDSATSQFFINTVNNTFLNHRDESPNGFGYAVFGKVVDGMDVVSAIEAVPTGNFGFYQDVPQMPIVISHVTLLEDKAE